MSPNNSQQPDSNVFRLQRGEPTAGHQEGRGPQILLLLGISSLSHNLGWLKKVCLPEFSALRGAVRDEKSWVPFMFVRPGREGDILLATWVL